MGQLGPFDAMRRDLHESFHDDGRTIGTDLLSFWRWGFSNVLSNATRGVLAEFIVAQALGVAEARVRDEWGPYDLETSQGIKIEVKSAAYVQSWYQSKFSDITFKVPKTKAWNYETNRQEDVAKRQADVYVFALLAHRDQSTIDPLDVSQWEFYVLPTAVLDDRERSQHSITLTRGGGLTFGQLKQGVETAAEEHRASAPHDER